jgi:hypothetical protein
VCVFVCCVLCVCVCVCVCGNDVDRLRGWVVEVAMTVSVLHHQLQVHERIRILSAQHGCQDLLVKGTTTTVCTSQRQNLMDSREQATRSEWLEVGGSHHPPATSPFHKKLEKHTLR